MKVNSLGAALPLQELAVFVAVAEAEGFSAAARRLGLSKAMVSTAVSRLEQRLGVRLLQRTTRRLSLTEAGAAALPHAQQSQLAAHDAAEAATLGSTTPRGVLRVNAPMSFGLLHVVPALGAFARAFPEVRVDLVLDDRVLDTGRGRLQSGPTHRPAARLGADRADRGPQPDGAGGPPPLSGPRGDASRARGPGRSRGAAVFAGVGRPTLVAVPGPPAGDGQGQRAAEGQQRLALRQAVLQGLGIAAMPLFVVGEDLAKKRLVRVLPAWDLPEQPIHAVTTAATDRVRKTRAFIDFFRNRLGDRRATGSGASQHRRERRGSGSAHRRAGVRRHAAVDRLAVDARARAADVAAGAAHSGMQAKRQTNTGRHGGAAVRRHRAS